MTVEDRDYYLLDHPPARTQYYVQRKSPISGTFVVHTAENATDLVLPDDGAEGVARFISTRSTPGSYHSIMDSDSTIPLIPPSYQAFHDGTGSNRYSIGVSFACQAHQWPTLPTDWIVGAMEQAGREVALLIDWVKDTTGIIVPLDHISGADSQKRRPGFTTHKEREDVAGTPGRRSDPGAAFPWDLFFESIKIHQTPTEDDDDMELKELAEELLATTRLSTTPEKLVTATYRQILDRRPDKSGFASWVKYLEDGGSVAQMVKSFQNSPEGQEKAKQINL